MASSTPSTDMTETVCQYPACSKQLKDLKLLPCLHRYCRECLTSVIQSGSEGMFKCPVCKQDCEIPENGVDGFKTDLHMTNRLWSIKLKDLFLNNHQKQLFCSCCKESTTPAYSFKFGKLLCQHCFQSHFGMFEDHHLHTPMCADHVTERAQLCCSTCKGVPICVKCVTDTHKGHDLLDVVELAKIEKESLEKTLTHLAEQEKDLDKIVRGVRPKHASRLMQISKMLHIQSELTENNTTRDKMVEDVEISSKEARYKLRVKFEKDMKKLDQQRATKLKEVEEKHDETKAECQRNMETIKQTLQTLSAKGEMEDELQSIFDFYKQLIERNENVNATSSSFLRSKDVWSDAQCIPHIREAIESLILKTEQAFSQIGRTFKLNGTYKCNDVSKCTVCREHVVMSNTLTSYVDKKTYQTECHITCTTSNVIYLITCKVCGMQYVGQSIKGFKQRLAEHRHAVNNKTQTTLGKHFKSVLSMELRGITSNSENLDGLEKMWIKKLCTLHPKGLNKIC